MTCDVVMSAMKADLTSITYVTFPWPENGGYRVALTIAPRVARKCGTIT